LTIKSTSHTTRRYFLSRFRILVFICMPVKIFSFQRSIVLKNSGDKRHLHVR